VFERGLTPRLEPGLFRGLKPSDFVHPGYRSRTTMRKLAGFCGSLSAADFLNFIL
jgi:hypothetical protein